MTKMIDSNKITVTMLVIGDEILNGRTKDLNATFLARYLFEVGIHLKSVEFFRDNEEEYRQALDQALKSSDIVITSGGIGPTLDDLTKKCLADYFKKPLLPNKETEKIVLQNYERFGRTWEPTLNYYHHFPQDFFAFNNPKGLAPGLGYFDNATNSLVLSAPGVPREFEAMVQEEFFPYIEKKFSNRYIKSYQTVVRTHSISEEKIFGEYAPDLWQQLEKFGKVSSLPHTIGIDIVVTYSADEKLHLQNQNLIYTIFKKSALAKFIWQYGNLNLNQALLDKLIEKNMSIGFAESCTGGLTSSKLTDLNGASAVFLGSVISYSNDVKINILNVSPKTLELYGAVSTEVAEEMARGLKEKLKVDMAIAITGIAGPAGGTLDKPVGTVCYAVATSEKIISEKQNMPGDRVRKKDRFSEFALWLAYRSLQQND